MVIRGPEYVPPAAAAVSSTQSPVLEEAVTPVPLRRAFTALEFRELNISNCPVSRTPF